MVLTSFYQPQYLAASDSELICFTLNATLIAIVLLVGKSGLLDINTSGSGS